MKKNFLYSYENFFNNDNNNNNFLIILNSMQFQSLTAFTIYLFLVFEESF